MQKKGISPLIATVLILGFTVALAAVIMTWGTGFTKRMQTQTEDTANIQVICATDVSFDIKSVCKSSSGYQLLMQNDGTEDITAWRLRFYEDETKANPVNNITTDIVSFGLDKIIVSNEAIGLTSVRKVEAIPVIERSGQEVVCGQTLDSYGDVNSDPITLACTS